MPRNARHIFFHIIFICFFHIFLFFPEPPSPQYIIDFSTLGAVALIRLKACFVCINSCAIPHSSFRLRWKQFVSEGKHSNRLLALENFRRPKNEWILRSPRHPWTPSSQRKPWIPRGLAIRWIHGDAWIAELGSDESLQVRGIH